MEGGFDDFLSLNKQLGTLGLSLKQIPGGSKKIFGLCHISKSKSLPPSHLWEFRLPVTALALSAHGPFGPARFARGLDNQCEKKLFF